MKTSLKSLFLIIFFLFFLVADNNFLSAESLNRALVAVQKNKESVFVSFRLHADDPKDITFKLYKSADSGKKEVLLKSGFFTNFTDEYIFLDDKITYKLKTFLSDKEIGKEETFTVKTESAPKPYIEIPLSGEYTFQQITTADLDGDGELEFLIKQPNFNVDPYQKEGYWKKSESTYKIEAYKLNGKLLWSYDMGWAIEEGIWYSPWIVFDVDGDGSAEVYCKAGEGDPRDEKGLVKDGAEYLVKLDGKTGKIISKTNWIPREGFPDYNFASRNFLTIAFLDGKTPSIIMQRGTYNLIITRALDKDFKNIWEWKADKEKKPKFWAQGAHTLIAQDIDEDGKDELIIGAAVLEEDGREKWSLEKGHPDAVYIADIDPKNPGLEIFYNFETKQKSDGICLVDAKSGQILWGADFPTAHIHSQGMAADILSKYPGMELFGGERDDKKAQFLYSSSGKLIKQYEALPLSIRALWWTDKPQKQVILKNIIQDWFGEAYQKVEGSVIAVMDCLGDYREEVITSLKGKIRIYTTTVSSDKSAPSLLEDAQYRKGVVNQTSGYYYPAQLSYKNRNMIK